MPRDSRQFTAARLTAGGRGAVATIRICAPPPLLDDDPEASRLPLRALDSLFFAVNGLSISDQPLTKIVFGGWGKTDREDLVVCRLAENVIEIHCHGGEAAVQRVLADLSDVGFTIVDWRSQVVASQGVIDAECLDVLSRTSTWPTTRIALEQANGSLKSAFAKLKDIATQSEKNVFEDYVDELLCWADLGTHLSTPWNVVLTGRPNVGKSSLINAMLGYQRAIVFDQPGTTRDVVTGETAFDGWPVILSDTAGIRGDAIGLEAAGIALARDRLRSANLRLLLVDLGEPPTADDDLLLREWPDAIVIGHKADRSDCWRDRLPTKAIRVSSVTGMGMVELQQRLVERLVPIVPAPGAAIPITDRQVQCLRAIQSSQTTEECIFHIERLMADMNHND